MTCKEAYDNTCKIIENAYAEYKFRYYKTKKEIRGSVNGCDIVIRISTSRDNSADYFVSFVFNANVSDVNGTVGPAIYNGVKFYKGEREHIRLQLQGEDVSEILDGWDSSNGTEGKETMNCRFMPNNWNIAFPQHQLRCAKDVCYILDTVLFSSPEVIEALCCQVKADIDYE